MTRTLLVTPAQAAELRAKSAASAHERIDALERVCFGLARRVAELEAQRRAAHSAAHQRVSAAAAARRLGVSLATVRRLIVAGDLRGAALRLPDRERRAWVVDAADLARIERAGGTAGAPGAASGAPARDKSF